VNLYNNIGVSGIAALICAGITGNSVSVKPAAKVSKKPVQKAGNPTNNCGLWYRAYVEELGWLAPVHDGQIAGTTGCGWKY
jgi:hypothetical protein